MSIRYEHELRALWEHLFRERLKSQLNMSHRFAGDRWEHHDGQSNLRPGASTDVSRQSADADDVIGREKDGTDPRLLHGLPQKYRQSRRDSAVSDGSLHGRGEIK